VPVEMQIEDAAQVFDNMIAVMKARKNTSA
jgi:K+/H+ antiporter YhaU regulatory subunit KhtT